MSEFVWTIYVPPWKKAFDVLSFFLLLMNIHGCAYIWYTVHHQLLKLWHLLFNYPLSRIQSLARTVHNKERTQWKVQSHDVHAWYK